MHPSGESGTSAKTRSEASLRVSLGTSLRTSPETSLRTRSGVRLRPSPEAGSRASLELVSGLALGIGSKQGVALGLP